MTIPYKRTHDIQGQSIAPCKEYYIAEQTIQTLIIALDNDNVDRSDIALTLLDLISSAQFTLSFLPKRTLP